MAEMVPKRITHASRFPAVAVHFLFVRVRFIPRCTAALATTKMVTYLIKSVHPCRPLANYNVGRTGKRALSGRGKYERTNASNAIKVDGVLAYGVAEKFAKIDYLVALMAKMKRTSAYGSLIIYTYKIACVFIFLQQFFFKPVVYRRGNRPKTKSAGS